MIKLEHCRGCECDSLDHKALQKRQEEIAALEAENVRLREELLNTKAGIDHDLFENVCCERDTVEAENRKLREVLQVAKEALKRISFPLNCDGADRCGDGCCDVVVSDRANAEDALAKLAEIETREQEKP